MQDESDDPHAQARRARELRSIGIVTGLAEASIIAGHRSFIDEGDTPDEALERLKSIASHCWPDTAGNC